MNTKSKSAQNENAELHFVSSLQLEQSVMLIGDMADDHHQVTLTEVSPDEFKFHIDYLPEQSKLAKINGTLQRWNGTETKIDADGDVLRLETGNTQRSHIAYILGTLLVTVGASGVAIIGEVAWLVVPIIISGIGTGFYTTLKTDDDNPRVVLFRYRDYLLQRLIDAFKTTGEVEAI